MESKYKCGATVGKTGTCMHHISEHPNAGPCLRCSCASYDAPDRADFEPQSQHFQMGLPNPFRRGHDAWQSLNNPEPPASGANPESKSILDPTLPIEEFIAQAVGAASMCWDNPGGAGVFHSDRAVQIVDEIMRKISEALR